MAGITKISTEEFEMQDNFDAYQSGVWTGREDMFETFAGRDIAEIDWIIENLSWFFSDSGNVDSVAVSKAITRLLYAKRAMEAKLDQRKKDRKAP
jgi:hypothetical protein